MLFLHRLAAYIGTHDVDGLANEISVRQLRRWLAFYKQEPFGNDWRRTARSTVIVAKAVGAKLEDTAEEMFLPTYDPAGPTQTEEQMLAELMKVPSIRKQIEASKK